jgi:hypothetical protein
MKKWKFNSTIAEAILKGVFSALGVYVIGAMFAFSHIMIASGIFAMQRSNDSIQEFSVGVMALMMPVIAVSIARIFTSINTYVLSAWFFATMLLSIETINYGIRGIPSEIATMCAVLMLIGIVVFGVWIANREYKHMAALDALIKQMQTELGARGNGTLYSRFAIHKMTAIDYVKHVNASAAVADPHVAE